MTGLEILLVTSPGLELALYEPLVTELRERGASVTPVAFPCSGDAASHTESLVRAAQGHTVVVAHGLGATLALSAADRLDVERWILVGPVLDVVPGPWIHEASALTVDARVELSEIPVERGDAILGEGWTEVAGCLAPGFARDLQTWARTGALPVDPTRIDEPVWVELGLLDEIASVEANVPASRSFPTRELVRPGVARLDSKDYRHLDLVRDPVPVKLAAKAAVEGW